MINPAVLMIEQEATMPVFNFFDNYAPKHLYFLLKFDNAQKAEAGKRGKNNVLLQIQSLYTPGRSRKKQIPISFPAKPA
jgi:hypothetical protein